MPEITFRVLVINNGAQLPTATIRLCEEMCGVVTLTTPYDVQHHSDQFDLVVLTGSSGVPAVYLRDEYATLFSYLRTTTTPVFGICYGAQLINLAFGGTLRDRGEKQKGLFVVLSTELSTYLPPDEFVLVYKGHRWVIDRVAPEFAVHATSASGPDIIAHVERPIIGVQFHPEKERDVTRASDVFKRFVATHVSAQNLPIGSVSHHVAVVRE